jgi:hypothetical protein
MIGNLTDLIDLGLNKYPAMWIKPQDNVPVYLVKLSEPDIDFDLNMDGVKNMTFYIISFDGYPDGLQELDRILVDDDLEITEPWLGDWSVSSFYDFYGNESGMTERYGSMPTSMWSGYIEFGNTEEVPWEDAPSYSLVQFDTVNDKIRIMKSVWIVEPQSPIAVLTKVYDFDSDPISGANVTLVRMFKFSPFGFEEISSNITYVKDSLSDNDGYHMIHDMRPSSGDWEQADYLGTLEIDYNGRKELVDFWFAAGVTK